MGSEVAERTAPGHRRIRHPAEIRVEPAAERTTVAVHMPDARNGSEHAPVHQALERAVDRRSPHEVSRLKHHTGPLDRGSHLNRVRRRKSERLFDEEIHPGSSRGEDDLLVTVRLGADDNGFSVRLFPEIFNPGNDLAAEFSRIFLRPHRLRIPYRDDFHARTRFQPRREIRHVNVRNPGDSNSFHRTSS